MNKKIIMMSLLGGVMVIALIAGSVALRRNNYAAFDRNYIWYVEYDAGSGRDMLVRGAKIKGISHDINKIILVLNRTAIDAEASAVQPEGAPLEPPKLRLQKVGNGIAYIEVINAEYLTQRMGTSGAQNYLAAATYSLTEAPGVRVVNYAFPVGDHAMPGEYTRENFKDYVIAGR